MKAEYQGANVDFAAEFPGVMPSHFHSMTFCDAVSAAAAVAAAEAAAVAAAAAAAAAPTVEA